MIIGLIPARLNSSRLPNKPIRRLGNSTIIGHVLKKAAKSKKLDKIVVCVDSKKVADEVSKQGHESFMTNSNIKNGTERIASYLKKNNSKYKNLKLVVDIQCDEVFLNPKYLDKIIQFHLKNLNKYDVVIPHSITNEKNNKNYVKIISDTDNNVLYLSRSDSPVNFRSKFSGFKRHMDFITFKPSFLTKFKNLQKRDLENYEGVELLRVLENGYKIGTIKMKEDSFSINTLQDLKKANKIIKKR
jgi:3-deoxy-manno-octulosonate cytidylyltransferase (CMP-KDO synthetase)